jgi:hypothetical protein
MVDLSQLEATYRHFADHLYDLLPDGVINIDLAEFRALGLLHCSDSAESLLPALHRTFQVLESSEKITLFNSEFLVWLIPQESQGVTRTLVLIAINQGGEPHLEMAFEARGAYNTSRRVLTVLEHYLADIQENEAFLSQLH